MLNPLSRDLQNMRQTLLFGGLENIIHNINHGNENIKIYEFGKTYHKNTNAVTEDVTERYAEEQKLALWISGKKQHESWQEKQSDTDFFFAKNILENAFMKIHVNMHSLRTQPDSSHAYLNNALQYMANNHTMAVVGEIKQEVLKYFDIKQPVFYAEVDCLTLQKIQQNNKIVFEDLNKFPEVNRDLALLIDQNITYEQIEQISFRTEKRYLKSMNLFDVYQGKNLDAGKKSYAIRYVLSNKEKTLTNDEITRIMDKLVAAYEKELNAKLRS